jgi:hypothetical protein
MPIRPVLIVEDDTVLRATLAEHLIAEGSFLPEEAGSVADAEAKLSALIPTTMPSCSMLGCRMAMAATSAPSCGGTA